MSCKCLVIFPKSLIVFLNQIVKENISPIISILFGNLLRAFWRTEFSKELKEALCKIVIILITSNCLIFWRRSKMLLTSLKHGQKTKQNNTLNIWQNKNMLWFIPKLDKRVVKWRLITLIVKPYKVQLMLQEIHLGTKKQILMISLLVSIAKDNIRLSLEVVRQNYRKNN